MIRRGPADPDRAALATAEVPGPIAPVRLDRFVSERFAAFPTRASARKAIARGEFAVNGVISEGSRWMQPGDTVCWLEPDDRAHAPPPEVAIAVVFEDDTMAVVIKPAGLATSGVGGRTLERALVSCVAPSPRPDALARPRVVHRLDAPTQGLVAVAKTRGAHAALGQAFEERRVQKRYCTIVVGRLEGAGTIAAPIDGREARTRWAAVAHTPALRGGWVTTVSAWPETGRTHQIRRHLAGIGHAVLGDRAYGSAETTLRGQGLFLAAVGLVVPHPDRGEPVAIEIGDPPKFAAFREREARRWARWHTP